MNLSNPIAPQNPTRHYLANNRIKAREHPFTLPFQINLVSEKPKFFTLIIPVSARKSQRPQKKKQKNKNPITKHTKERKSPVFRFSLGLGIYSHYYTYLCKEISKNQKNKNPITKHTQKKNFLLLLQLVFFSESHYENLLLWQPL